MHDIPLSSPEPQPTELLSLIPSMVPLSPLMPCTIAQATLDASLSFEGYACCSICFITFGQTSMARHMRYKAFPH